MKLIFNDSSHPCRPDWKSIVRVPVQAAILGDFAETLVASKTRKLNPGHLTGTKMYCHVLTEDAAGDPETEVDFAIYYATHPRFFRTKASLAKCPWIQGTMKMNKHDLKGVVNCEYSPFKNWEPE